MYRGGVVVNEFDGLLYNIRQLLDMMVTSRKIGGRMHTAMPNSPHFIVSSLMLFRFMCHLNGTRRSVATYMYDSVW
jgi:hypothetical protein